MREQGLVNEVAVTGYRCLDGEALVGGDVLDEAEQLGREWLLRQRLCSVGADPCWELDDVVVREAGEGAVVADVDHLDLAVAGGERPDQLRCRVAVVRAAASLEQLRLGREVRIAVELEQLPLDLGDLGGPRGSRSLALE